MNKIIGNMLNYHDRVQVASLGQRMVRNNVITANLANAETPGFRALGYSFEDQLAEAASIGQTDGSMKLRTTSSQHLLSPHANAAGGLDAEVFISPTESIPEDGNTVDVDKEMAAMSQNQILYRTAVELINRKLASIRYAISGGSR